MSNHIGFYHLKGLSMIATGYEKSSNPSEIRKYPSLSICITFSLKKNKQTNKQTKNKKQKTKKTKQNKTNKTKKKKKKKETEKRLFIRFRSVVPEQCYSPLEHCSQRGSDEEEALQPYGSLGLKRIYETCSHKMRDKSQNFISKL